MNPFEAHNLADKRVKLAEDYSNLTEELSAILTVKAIKWSMFRADPECKSDTAATRKWEATPEGIREMQIKLKMKAWEKQISAIKTLLDVLNAEARNQM